MSKVKFNQTRDRVLKACKLPWFLLLIVLSKIIPRKPDLWVFSRQYGFGGGPLALLNSVRARDQNVQVIWLATSDVDQRLAARLNIKCVQKSSTKALWYCLRASYGVATHGFSDLRGPAIWGAFVIQLWHGSPLKKIGFDINGKSRATGIKGFLSNLSAKFEEFWISHYNLIVAPSSVVKNRYISAFNIVDDRIQVLGDPRVDLIVNDSGPDTDRAIFQNGLVADASKIVLYAPTWREYGLSEILPQNEDIERLLELLNRTQSVLLIRMHPYASEAFDRYKGEGRLVFVPSDTYPDILPLLKHIDVLITDFSSIAIDYALLRRPIIYVSPDCKNYVETRGVYESYEKFTAGGWFETWPKALDQLERMLGDEDQCRKWYEQHVSQLIERYHTFAPGGNSRRVLEYVLSSNL